LAKGGSLRRIVVCIRKFEANKPWCAEFGEPTLLFEMEYEPDLTLYFDISTPPAVANQSSGLKTAGNIHWEHHEH